jgi:hypothetical protein
VFDTRPVIAAHVELSTEPALEQLTKKEAVAIFNTESVPVLRLTGAEERQNWYTVVVELYPPAAVPEDHHMNRLPVLTDVNDDEFIPNGSGPLGSPGGVGRVPTAPR